MNGKEIGALVGSILLPGFGSYAGYCVGNAEDEKKEDAARREAQAAAEAAAAKPPPAADYSDAALVASDNARMTTMAQILSQEFALAQTAADRYLQRAAQLELALEKFDTNLQTSRMAYLEMMTREENRHTEAMLPAPPTSGKDE